MIGRHLNAGLIDKYMEVLGQFNTAIGIQQRRRECKATNTSTEITNLYCDIKPSLEMSIQTVLYSLFVLLIGLSICTIVFLSEALLASCTNILSRSMSTTFLLFKYKCTILRKRNKLRRK